MSGPKGVGPHKSVGHTTSTDTDSTPKPRVKADFSALRALTDHQVVNNNEKYIYSVLNPAFDFYTQAPKFEKQEDVTAYINESRNHVADLKALKRTQFLDNADTLLESFIESLEEITAYRVNVHINAATGPKSIQHYKITRTEAVLNKLKAEHPDNQAAIALLEKRLSALENAEPQSLVMGRKKDSTLKGFLSRFFSFIKSIRSNKAALAQDIKAHLKDPNSTYALPLSDDYLIEDTILESLLTEILNDKKAAKKFCSEALVTHMNRDKNWQDLKVETQFITEDGKHYVFESKAGAVGKQSSMDRATNKLANAWVSEFDVESVQLKHIRMATLSAFGVTDKDARKVATNQRADELLTVIAEKFWSPKLSHIANVNLMTADDVRDLIGRGKPSAANEKLMTLEQQAALDAIAQESGYTALNFTFAVNQGAFSGISLINGTRAVKAQNAASMEALFQLVDGMPATQENQDLILELRAQIKQMWDDETFLEEGNEPYKMASRIALITDLLDSTVTVTNCKSGKDRTSQVEAEMKYLIAKFAIDGALPQPDAVKSDSDMRLMHAIVINSGNFEIQATNTGAKGYKLKGVKTLLTQIGGDAKNFFGLSGFVKS